MYNRYFNEQPIRDMQINHIWFEVAHLVVVAAIASGVLYVIYKVAMQYAASNQQKSDSALEIAKQRYAKGEIDKEALEHLKKTLTD